MMDLNEWQENNSRYLSAALNWLRLRLERYAGQQVPEPKTPLPALTPATAFTPTSMPLHKDPVALRPAPRRFLFWGRSPDSVAAGQTPGPQAAPRLLLPPGSGVTDEQVAEAAAEMIAAALIDPPPALHILSERLGLSPFERDVLLLCAAMELDTRIAGLCARAQGDASRPYPTFALALALFEDGAWEALSPERPLRHWRLIEINQPGGQPLTTSALRADERIVNYIKGLNYLDDRLAPLMLPFEERHKRNELPPSQLAVVWGIVRFLEHGAKISGTPIVQMLGPDSSSKQSIAWRVAAEFGLHLYRLPADSLPAQPSDMETFMRLWHREIALLPVALYLDAHDLDGSQQPDSRAAQVSHFLVSTNQLVFLDTRDIWPGLSQSTLSVDVAKPVPAEQQDAWAEALVPIAGDSPAQLAGQFNLNLEAIRQIAKVARAETGDDGYGLPARLWDTCLLYTRPQLDVLAQRLDAKATWETIVLPDTEMELLHQIAAQVRQRTKVYEKWGFARTMNRGLGINALFAGDSGTGKTMAAEVIANSLRLNLYRIDLSTVVSKYIGETEKNLRKLFDAAEDGGAILFFDEADALFGKRSEVKDSHDRYANIEVSYLLQRIEAYRGLAILATNMKSALDQAFLRRLRFIVNFPFPGPPERKAIWQKVFPLETHTQGLDFDRLSRLNLTGGSIHNVALNAAFLAAQQGTHVTMPLVLAAARTEFRKLDRPINEADFRWLNPAEDIA